MDKVSLRDIEFIETSVEMPLMSLPVRTTLITLQSGARLMFSPGSQIENSLFKNYPGVTDIIAPNLFHCGGIKKAMAAYPNAKVWGPPGASKKFPNISWTHELSVMNWPYQNELEILPVLGHSKVNEFVFFHPSTQSLVVCDLCFNMTNMKGLGPWIILKIFGTYNRFAVSKLFVKFVEDRELFLKSLAQIMARPFQNIIINHGQNVIGNGKALLGQALNERGYSVPL